MQLMPEGSLIRPRSGRYVNVDSTMKHCTVRMCAANHMYFFSCTFSSQKLEVTVMRNEWKKVTVTVVPNALTGKEPKRSSIPLLNLWNKVRKFVWANHEL